MIDRDVRLFILRALQASGNLPLSEDVLLGGVRAAFPGVAFTNHELQAQLHFCESQGWIIGARNPLIGVIWALTTAGQMQAAQFCR